MKEMKNHYWTLMDTYGRKAAVNPEGGFVSYWRP